MMWMNPDGWKGVLFTTTVVQLRGTEEPRVCVFSSLESVVRALGIWSLPTWHRNHNTVYMRKNVRNDEGNGFLI
jgi:hypothetical protein